MQHLLENVTFTLTIIIKALKQKNPLKNPSIFAIITNASMHDANIL